MKNLFVFFSMLWSIIFTGSLPAEELNTEELNLRLRFQQPTSEKSNRYHRLTRKEEWKPNQTAVIVCDVWDYHHCLNAVRRLNEFAPRLNQVLIQARNQGVTIIHAPSDCMPAYENHPARKRAIKTPAAKSIPQDIKSWCSKIPAEETGVYPIDQSDGGEDDDPIEHAAWAAKLKAMGRNPGLPWKKQSSLIQIDSAKDFISDKGDEVWSILEAKGIKNVILTGVHVNMCVLGRPFGLRQLVRNGKNVVLMRDMTDTMYNPARWPFVSHYTGNDLIISHIERFICPTITSDQILGGKPFRFSRDNRKHLVMVIAEDEYLTNQSLPKFADKMLGHDFRVSYVWGDDQERNCIRGLDVLNRADVALISVRRRVLPPREMGLIRQFEASGKPMVGIRTASHAFSLRKKKPPAGYVDWTEFDHDVWGGNYHNHYGNKLLSTVTVVSGTKHPILEGIPSKTRFTQNGSLYMTSPLLPGALPLMLGKVEGKPPEPVLWTYIRDNGGRSFYSSIGHLDDFENPIFTRAFLQGIIWAAELEGCHDPTQTQNNYWSLIDLPTTPVYTDTVWSRCVVRLPATWDRDLTLKIEEKTTAWWEGKEIKNHKIPADWIVAGEYHLLVVRNTGGLRQAPTLVAEKKSLVLKGSWQVRAGNEKDSFENMPLPAKFGASPDILFEP